MVQADVGVCQWWVNSLVQVGVGVCQWWVNSGGCRYLSVVGVGVCQWWVWVFVSGG